MLEIIFRYFSSQPMISRFLTYLLASVIATTSSIAWLQSVFWLSTDVQVILTDNEVEFWPEFIEALRFSHEHGLTKYKTVENFRPYEILTREQAAKIVWQFASKIMNKTKDETRTCEFSDIDWADSTLVPHILNSCKMWIFRGTSDGRYMPTWSITKAEALAVIVRMFKSRLLDESTDPRYLNYYLQAKKLWLTKESNIYSLNRPLTRYEMVLLLYRFYVKFNLIDMASNGDIEWIDIAINSVWKNIVVVDSWLFLDRDLEHIFVRIEDSTFRLEKESLVSQFENAYTRYWEVYKLVDDESMIENSGSYVWVATFNLINDVMTDWNIRPIELWDRYYQFLLSDTQPFYKIEKKLVSEAKWWKDPIITTKQTWELVVEVEETKNEIEEATSWSWDMLNENG